MSKPLSDEALDWMVKHDFYPHANSAATEIRALRALLREANEWLTNDWMPEQLRARIAKAIES